jgi:hypothetical protein
MGSARLCESWILARIWHSDLHFAAHSRIQPHTGMTGKITMAGSFRRSQGLICGF